MVRKNELPNEKAPRSRIDAVHRPPSASEIADDRGEHPAETVVAPIAHPAELYAKKRLTLGAPVRRNSPFGHGSFRPSMAERESDGFFGHRSVIVCHGSRSSSGPLLREAAWRRAAVVPKERNAEGKALQPSFYVDATPRERATRRFRRPSRNERRRLSLLPRRSALGVGASRSLPSPKPGGAPKGPDAKEALFSARGPAGSIVSSASSSGRCVPRSFDMCSHRRSEAATVSLARVGGVETMVDHVDLVPSRRKNRARHPGSFLNSTLRIEIWNQPRRSDRRRWFGD